MDTCATCKYYDRSDTSGGKCYCTYIRAYYYPGEKACSHHVDA